MISFCEILLLKCFLLFCLFRQQITSMMLLMAMCLFASVCSVLGMKTVYYRDGQVCDVCTDEQSVPYKQSYTPEEVGKRIVYRTEERIISQPSNSYVVNRADYSNRNLSSYIFFFFFSNNINICHWYRFHSFSFKYAYREKFTEIKTND